MVNDMKVEIRKVGKGDLKALAHVYADVYTRFDVGEKWSPDSAYKLLEYWYARNPDLCFAAICGGRPVGAFFADVKPWWDGNRLVDGELFVSHDFQKIKIGSRLSLALYREALEKYNAASFDTYTFKGHTHPLSWYKKQGFQENHDLAMISGDLRKVMTFLEKQVGFP